MKQKMNKTTYILATIAILSSFGIAYTITDGTPMETISIHSSMPEYNIEFLAKNTPHALIGTVIDVSPSTILEDKEHSYKIVFSDVTIDVERDLNDNYQDDQINVRIRGGTIDKVTTISSSDPTFVKGERVLIFVGDKEIDSIYGDNYYVAGLAYGKYKLENNKAYGIESPNGIDETQLISRISNARTG